MKTGYELVLPDGLLDFFEVIAVDEMAHVVVIHLDEQNIPPLEYKDKSLLSKGFYPPTEINDFPLRGKRLILRVRRRRWQDKETGNPVIRDWNLVAQGTRLTAEFAAFLKALP